ncbi:MAG: hypothetical protein RBG13Loki_0354 [Promethearchaeota archaeon CR_4]|nr:MAG: hypothetical protein RBG13Loki_0354 [Candidatus Lokiarchaeota archaeon CR_4]
MIIARCTQFSEGNVLLDDRTILEGFGHLLVPPSFPHGGVKHVSSFEVKNRVPKGIVPLDVCHHRLINYFRILYNHLATWFHFITILREEMLSF